MIGPDGRTRFGTLRVAAAADPDTGAFARTVGAALGELNAGIAKLITEEDVPLRTAVARSVEELTGNALSEIQRALAGQSRTIIDTLNSDNPASPLNGLRLELLRAQRAQGDAVQTQLNELRTVIDVTAAIKQTMERTAVKGADYEDDLEVVLDRLTRGTGDRLERTGAKPGLLGRSKKGDFVAGLPTELARTHTVNVVFEAKDKTQTLPEWQAELDEARRNRGAVAALGVVKGTEHMPGGDRLRLLDALTYVVAFDPATDTDDLLLAAYQLLRMHAVTTVLGADADIDVAALRVQLGKAVSTLGQIDAITGAAEKAKANLGTITATATRLRDDLTATLGRMQTLVESAVA